MKFGMNMLLWTDDATEERFLPLFEKLKKIGYDGVEIPIFNADVKKFEALGKRLDDIGLERTGVTVRGADDDPMSLDPKICKAGINGTKAALDCCQAAGVKILAGPYHSAIGLFSGCSATRNQWDTAVQSMREVAEHAAICDVTLAIEYLNRFETYLLNTAADTARFVRDVDRPRARMMYDTFHAHIEEKNVAEAIRTCADVTVHVHISENDRSTPGQGQVDWATTFDTLKETGYDGWMTVEAFGQALPALTAATKIWRKMFASEEQLARDSLAFMKEQWAKRESAVGVG